MIYCSQKFYNFLSTIKNSYPLNNGVIDCILSILPQLIVIDKESVDETKLENIMYFDLSKDIGYCLHKQFKKVTYCEMVESSKKNKLSKSKISFFLQSFRSYHKSSYTDSIFIEIFSNAWKLYQILGSCTFEVVSGLDIKKYYKTDNYDRKFGDGNLFGSCMNDNTHYLDIYVENVDKINLLVLKTEDNKVIGRSLLWKTESGLYMDKIYYGADFIHDIFILWGKSNHVKYDCAGKISMRPSRMVTKLNPSKYKYYPYLDTMEYYYPKTGVIMSYPDYDVYGSGFFRSIINKFRIVKNGKLIRLRSTSGTFWD
jgi:hypothetical protein